MRLAIGPAEHPPRAANEVCVLGVADGQRQSLLSSVWTVLRCLLMLITNSVSMFLCSLARLPGRSRWKRDCPSNRRYFY